MRPIVGGDSVPWSIAHDDPELRRSALYIINAAWCVLAFGFAVAMLVVGDAAQFLAGDRAGNVVWSLMMGACFFCLAGCAHVVRRWYWYLPKACRRLRAGDRPAYDDCMQRALPRNSGVVLQSVVGIQTTVIAFVVL